MQNGRERIENARKKALHGSTKNYGESGVRLDMYISGDANLQLGSLLQYLSLQGNVTKKQLIEQLIEQEYLKHVCDFPKDLFDCED